MFYHKEAVYFKPLMWKKDYYSFTEFCALLGVPVRSEAFLKLHQALEDKYYPASYTGFEDVYQFEKMRQTPNVNELITPRVLEKRECPCFLRVYGPKAGEISYLVSKAGVLAFLDAYQKELIQLGVNKSRLLALLHNMPIYDEAPAPVITLWDFTKKFTKNSKNVRLLSDFIVDNFFNTTICYQNQKGENCEEPMFFYVKGKRRSTTFHFNASLLPIVKEKYGPLLQKKASEIEAQNEWISLRRFLLEVSGSLVSDKKLKAFILDKALSDTFEDVDAQGNVLTQKMFDYENNILSMRKKAIIPFVTKYQAELEQLGIFGFHYILNQEQRRVDLPKEALTLHKLFSRSNLSQYTTLFQKLLQSQKAYNKKILNPKTGKKQPLFHPYYVKDKIKYYVLEKDVRAFFKLFYKDLLSLGIASFRLDELMGKSRLPRRSLQMVAMRDVFYKLGMKSSLFLPLSQEIEAAFSNETYLYKKPDGTFEKRPVFIKAKTNRSARFLFENQEAVQFFVKKHSDFFFKKGVSPLRLKDVTGESVIPPLNDNLVALNALAQLLNLESNRFNTYVHKKYLDTTYLVTDSNGVSVQKKMFTPVRLPSGHISYAIDKNAIPVFEKMVYQLKINSQRQRKA